MKYLLIVALIATVYAQKTDFGTFCFPDRSCTTNDDCDDLTACVNGNCISTLPGAPCNATVGCNPEVAVCRAGTCVLSPSGGTTQFAGCVCNAQNQCGRYQTCISGTCRSNSQPIGAPCNYDENCGSNAFCDHDNDSICTAKLANNQTCNSPQQCVSNYCEYSQNECQPKVANGQECTDSQGCISGFCLYNTTNGDRVCDNGLATGADCSANQYSCAVGGCSQFMNFTCVPKLYVNDSCSNNDICNSSICIQSKCAAQRRALGELCWSEGDCLSSYCYYDNSTCMVAYSLPVGQPCSRSGDCETMFCSPVSNSNSDRRCQIPQNKTVGQTCYAQAQCVQGSECVDNNVCREWYSVPLGGSCYSTRVCATNLWCNGSQQCDIDSRDECMFGATCALSHTCNCTSVVNRTNECVPNAQNTTNFLPLLGDISGKTDYCYFKYLAPIVKAEFPAECSEYNFTRSDTCERALANFACCSQCAAPIVIESGEFFYNCAVLTVRNATATCTGYAQTVFECGNWNPNYVPTTSSTSTTDTDSPAVRLNAILMFVLVAIVFVVAF